MFIQSLIKKVKSVVDTAKDIDKNFFAQVMEEIESGFKDKGCEGKAIAMSNGDDEKANSLYIEIRAKELHENFLNEQRELMVKAEKQKKFLKQVEQKKTNYIRDKGFNYFIDLYKGEFEANGFTKNSIFSVYHLKKGNSKFAVRLYAKQRELRIVDKNNETVLTFNLLDNLELSPVN